MFRLLLVLGVVASGISKAEEHPPCSAIEYHQFDFWIGDWQVFTQQGKLAGTSVIEIKHHGCVLRENWSSANDESTGSSLNGYDHQKNQWQQTWMDNSGLVLNLTGHWDGNSMIMTGDTIDQQGNKLSNKISWTPDENGNVIQQWSLRKQTGQWQQVFHGEYRKVKK